MFLSFSVQSTHFCSLLFYCIVSVLINKTFIHSFIPGRDITALLHEGTEREPETVEHCEIATHDRSRLAFIHLPTQCRDVTKRLLSYRRRTARRVMSVEILSTVETSCTTNQQQIEVGLMELDGSVSTTSSTVDDDNDEFVGNAIDLPWRSLGQSSRRKYPIFDISTFPYNTV